MVLKDKRILVTQEPSENKKITDFIIAQGAKVVSCPIEKYQSIHSKTLQNVLNNLDKYDNIVYGNLRNAAFFLDHIYEESVMEKILNRLNFALDQETAEFLEDRGIPAITAAPKTKPIDLVELMLRLGQTGACLYPCGNHFKEELPGFFMELDIPCKELEVYERRGPSETELMNYRSQLLENQPDFMLFHSVESVVRSKAAFPDLDWDEITKIAMDDSITQKLKEMEFATDNVITFENDKINEISF